MGSNTNSSPFDQIGEDFTMQVPFFLKIHSFNNNSRFLVYQERASELSKAGQLDSFAYIRSKALHRSLPLRACEHDALFQSRRVHARSRLGLSARVFSHPSR